MNPFHFRIHENYPFSLSTKDLRIEVSQHEILLKQATSDSQPIIYLWSFKHKNGEEVSRNKIVEMIMEGKNELSRRTNEQILKYTLLVAIISAIACILALFR